MSLLSTVRRSIAGGGLRPLIACAVIAWGFAELSKLADDRQVHLDDLDAAIAERRRLLEDVARDVAAARAVWLAGDVPPKPADVPPKPADVPPKPVGEELLVDVAGD